MASPSATLLTATALMACGHETHETLEGGRFVCVRCLGLDPRALLEATPAGSLGDPGGSVASSPIGR